MIRWAILSAFDYLARPPVGDVHFIIISVKIKITWSLCAISIEFDEDIVVTRLLKSSLMCSQKKKVLAQLFSIDKWR